MSYSPKLWRDIIAVPHRDDPSTNNLSAVPTSLMEHLVVRAKISLRAGLNSSYICKRHAGVLDTPMPRGHDLLRNTSLILLN